MEAEEEGEVLKRLDSISEALRSLDGRVRRLDYDVEAFKASVGEMDPVIVEKKLAELRKRTAEATEEVMRQVIALDGLRSSEAVRPLRKAQVLRAQDLLRTIDEETQKHLNEIDLILHPDRREDQRAGVTDVGAFQANDGPAGRLQTRNQRRKQRKRQNLRSQDKEQSPRPEDIPSPPATEVKKGSNFGFLWLPLMVLILVFVAICFLFTPQQSLGQ